MKNKIKIIADKNRRRHLIYIMFSVIIAAAFLICSDIYPQRMSETKRREIQRTAIQKTNAQTTNTQQEYLTAWWGTLYPQFCYAEIPESEDGPQRKPKVKISFWLAHVWDW